MLRKGTALTMASMVDRDDSSSIVKLELACSDLKTLLENSARMEASLGDMDRKFELIDEALAAASKRTAPLQSSSMAARALEARINRAVTPALSLLDAFKLSDSLQLRLLDLYEELSEERLAAKPSKRLRKMAKYVDCVDKLNVAISVIGREGEPVIQRLQEVVEFLSRTKAAEPDRTQRLREAVLTLKDLYEAEVDSMRFEGSLDQALLNLQDEYERLLQQIKHSNLEPQKSNSETEDFFGSDLGTELEVQVLRRISDTLASNDCLDICIGIYVKVRYRRVAKALMRLNPDYLRTYTPEEIDEMEWESLETAIALWIKHFELAVGAVLVAEKSLCERVLGGLMDGLAWPECFAKIADKIMAVFFRFGEGVARSTKEPQKLFKLLDMFAALESLTPGFSAVFGGDSGSDIRSRFRELVKLLIHASSKVYWEFGLQIEGNSDGFPPPQDGSVPKLVRYAINYLKYLATDDYRAPMTKVLQTERIWKSGALTEPESDENLFGDAIANVMEALQRNVESKRCRYRDRKILSNVFAMNTYWYIYMRTKNTELAKLLGEQYMKRKYKAVAEESAYLYQKQAWGELVALLETEDLEGLNSKEESLRLMREKVEAFANGFEEVLRSHRGAYCIPDGDLREQIREATVKLVVSSYREFVGSFQTTFRGRSFLTPEAIEGRLEKFFDGVGGKIGRRESYRDRTGQKTATSAEGEIRDFRRFGSNTSDT